MARFVDQVTLHLTAGDGGNGCASIHREKFKPLGGPDGGNGGHGGDIILEVSAQVHTLLDLHYRPHLKAERGSNGAGDHRNGARGADLVLPVPVGTVVLSESGEQLADLKRSRDDLLSIVEEIDARVQEVFAQAYEDTARQFASVFDRLFPGGEGRLVLTDPDDMLTTGIEIEARPAGKKVKRLSLLSGGERSLAAVALLVAIFKARPSPFYVMDEVEAALDDTNLGRLLEIFTELRRSSQLIIITHQKRTMEVADALYGITMRDGITKAVSQRLAQPDRDAAVTPDV